jgi:hypothetical protein
MSSLLTRPSMHWPETAWRWSIMSRPRQQQTRSSVSEVLEDVSMLDDSRAKYHLPLAFVQCLGWPVGTALMKSGACPVRHSHHQRNLIPSRHLQEDRLWRAICLEELIREMTNISRTQHILPRGRLRRSHPRRLIELLRDVLILGRGLALSPYLRTLEMPWTSS